MHVAIVAGESSGDQLGAAIIDCLRQRLPSIEISGMAGPRMKSAGCAPVANMDELAVMGLVEVLKKYRQLRHLRDRICDHYIQSRPDVFVGIDVPDFALGIAARLRRHAIKTVHVVAPQIWAWRESRAKKLAQQLDLLLTLFPFEQAFFERYALPAICMGHPLADRIPLTVNRADARARVGVASDGSYLALLPGSREQEWTRLSDAFLATASIVAADRPELRFIAAAINTDAHEYLLSRHRAISPALPLTVAIGQSHDVLAACEVALVASGTVTMEAVFTKTPIVVAYKLAPLNYQILKRMVRVPHIAMPNILHGGTLVPEFIQADVEPRKLATALCAWLDDKAKLSDYAQQCQKIHCCLRRDAAACAATEILRIGEIPGG